MTVAARSIVAALGLGLSACSEPPAPGDDARADPRAPQLVSLGERVYAQECASCHGAKLEGQPEWRRRLPNGRLPAPPHDESGHSWHHADPVLFAITKNGLVPPHAPKDYESDMPAYGGRLSDGEIWAVLAYIKSHWRTGEVLAARAEMTRNARPQ
ncbi:MAG: cytochrome c [Betaproteobacteria bacterium]|nr:MAG: cytochrome c [Betaproteobacteria bacterium]